MTMAENDDAAAAFYEQEENRRARGKPRKRKGQSTRLTTHVPVRFDARVIDSVKRFADEDGMTVSSWIRKTVDQEVRLRLARLTSTGSTAPVSFDVIEGPEFPSSTTVDHLPYDIVAR